MKITYSSIGLFRVILTLFATTAFTCQMRGQTVVFSISSETNAVVTAYNSSGATSSFIQLPISSNNWGNGGITYDGNGHIFAGSGNIVGEYTLAGSTVNSSLISSLYDVFGLVVDGGHLFVIWQPLQGFGYNAYVGEFSTNGTPVNSTLINLNGKNCVSLKGDGNGHLFLLTGDTIEEYSTSGATLSLPLINLPTYCSAFAVDKNGYIYIANGNGSTTTISKYTTAGTLVDASLISDLPSVSVDDMTLDGNGHLLLGIESPADSTNHISEYTTSGQLLHSFPISYYPRSIVAIPSTQPTVNLIKAVVPTFSDLLVGTNYQLQVSSDMNTWTNQGSPFTATNSSMVYPQYWGVQNWNQLFFRLQEAP